VTVTTRKPERIEELSAIADQLFLLEGDLKECLTRLLKGKQVLLLAMAADTPQAYEATYLHLAETLVEVVSKMATGITQILYTSSTSIYGEHGGNWVEETTPPRPANRYAEILLETEQVLQKLSTPNRRVCLFRLGEIYGPGREIAERLRRMTGQPLAGTGDNYTNIIHLDKITAALTFAVTHQLDGVYNLCEETHIKRRDLYAQICEREGLPPVQWDPTRSTLHGGNKRVSSAKLQLAALTAAPRGSLPDSAASASP
jgi:nucleoside-diphosphate-sugar epimerase